MDLITSRQNNTIKAVRKLQSSRKARRRAGQYVIEGKRLVTEALAAQVSLAAIVLCPDYLAETAPFVVPQVPTLYVTADVFDSCSDTAHGQGVLAIVADVRPAPVHKAFALVVDGVTDPGNLGTILRTAAASGVDVVYLSPNSVDFLSPKVLRSGMGAHFRLPIVEADWAVLSTELAQHQVLLADVAAGTAYDEVAVASNVALIVSSEADGASSAARALASALIHIPMKSDVESLNVSVACGVLLVQLMRARGR